MSLPRSVELVFARARCAAWAAVFGLACGFGGCTRSTGDGPGFAVVSTGALVDGATWETNRPLEIRFSAPVDLATANADTVQIHSLLTGASAVGTFSLKSGSRDRTLVFQPRCPIEPSATDTGLERGASYRLAIPAARGNAQHASVLRSRSGEPLHFGVERRFTTHADPQRIFDARPNAGPALTHVYLGSALVYPDPRPGAPTTPFTIGTNTLVEPTDPLVLHFDQPLHPSLENVSPRHLELFFAGPAGEVGVPLIATLVESCGHTPSAVMLSPIGVLPAGARLRLRVARGLRDLSGEEAGIDREPLALRVERHFGVVADQFFEDFRTRARFDADAEQIEPRAIWSTRERALQAATGFDELAERSEFDWVVRGTQIIDTASDLITDDSSGRVMQVESGVVYVRSLVIEAGAALIAQGPLPLQIWCRDRAEIHGVLDASGVSAVGASWPCRSLGPMPGGAGRCSSGDGGMGAPETTRTSPRGGPGAGAYRAAEVGGSGGDAGVGMATGASAGAGGGGGTWRLGNCTISSPTTPRDEGLCGRSGGPLSRTCEGTVPTRGGVAGPAIFRDASAANDFFGLHIHPATGAITHGELALLQGGQGGGGGGDAVVWPSCPNPYWNNRGSAYFACDFKGGGGGSGGGALVIRAMGAMRVSGVVRATGGSGANGVGTGSTGDNSGSGGGGAGGMIVLMSATSLDLTGGTIDARGGTGGPGRGRSAYPADGAGGHGGAGVIQLHVPDPELHLVPRDPSTTPRAVILEPDFGRVSIAQTQWIATGFTNFGSGNVGDPPAYEFDGIETSGPDAGLVRRTSSGTVAPLPRWPGAYRAPLERAGTNTLRLEGLPGGIENPALLIAWELVDLRARASRTFTIAGASFSYGALHLATDPTDGDLRRTLDFTGGAAEVALAPRYFRVRTDGDEDAYPPEVRVFVQFQGAESDPRDPSVPDLGTLVPNAANPREWSGDVGALRGKSFFRVRFRFERDLGEQLTPLELRFFKLPFRF